MSTPALKQSPLELERQIAAGLQAEILRKEEEKRQREIRRREAVRSLAMAASETMKAEFAKAAGDIGLQISALEAEISGLRSEHADALKNVETLQKAADDQHAQARLKVVTKLCEATAEKARELDDLADKVGETYRDIREKIAALQSEPPAVRKLYDELLPAVPAIHGQLFSRLGRRGIPGCVDHTFNDGAPASVEAKLRVVLREIIPEVRK